MAENSGRNKSIDELRAEIAGSRERVGRDCAACAMNWISREISQIISGTNVSWITAAARSVRDRFGADAEEENLCGCKKQPQIAEEAGRNWLCVGCVESRRSLARPVIVEFVKNRLTDFGGKSRRKT
jgi:hypothetical protein